MTIDISHLLSVQSIEKLVSFLVQVGILSHFLSHCVGIVLCLAALEKILYKVRALLPNIILSAISDVNGMIHPLLPLYSHWIPFFSYTIGSVFGIHKPY